MEILVMDSNFEPVSILDVYKSLIWTDRYSSYGDFEIYTPVTNELLSCLREDYYLWIKDSEHVMIVEDIEVKSDVEEGNYLISTGRSLESILDRRIVWDQTILTGSLQNGIQTLLNDAIISPTIVDRTINNFIFETSVDSRITSLNVDAQIPRGSNLYNVIQTLCLEKNIGFKITLSDTNQFIFKLYAGIDRSYEQFENPYIVFSSKYDNLINADYTQSKKGLKNVTLVAGEGEEMTRKSTVVGSGASLSRRELYTDASNISQNDGETVLTDEEYLGQLIQRGTEDLSKCITTTSFDSQIDSISNLFKYNQDYFMGDVVQIDSDYGIESRARVTEIIFSQDDDGLKIYPTLSIVDVEEVQADGVLIPGPGGESGGSEPIVDSDIIVTDVNNHFTATKLDGVLDELFTSVSNGKDDIAASITGKGVPASGSDTFPQLADKIDLIEQFFGSGDAVEADVLTGKTFTNNIGSFTGTMPDRGTVSTDITTKAQQVTIAQGFHSGSGIVKISAAEQAKIIAGNIKSGVTLLGQAGSSNVVDTSPGTAVAGDILVNKIAFVDGAQITGTMPDRGTVSTDITTKAQQVAIAAGKHSGSGVVKISAAEQAKIIAGNIKSGVTILGQAGSLTSSLEYIHVFFCMGNNNGMNKTLGYHYNLGDGKSVYENVVITNDVLGINCGDNYAYDDVFAVTPAIDCTKYSELYVVASCNYSFSSTSSLTCGYGSIQGDSAFTVSQAYTSGTGHLFYKVALPASGIVYGKIRGYYTGASRGFLVHYIGVKVR
jgi:hypothetical protein